MPLFSQTQWTYCKSGVSNGHTTCIVFSWKDFCGSTALRNERADRLESTVNITFGLQLGKTDVVKSLGNFLNMNRSEHCSTDRLKVRGAEKGSGRHSTHRGRERSVFNETNIGTVSRATLRNCWQMGQSGHKPHRTSWWAATETILNVRTMIYVVVMVQDFLHPWWLKIGYHIASNFSWCVFGRSRYWIIDIYCEVILGDMCLVSKPTAQGFQNIAALQIQCRNKWTLFINLNIWVQITQNIFAHDQSWSTACRHILLRDWTRKTLQEPLIRHEKRKKRKRKNVKPHW